MAHAYAQTRHTEGLVGLAVDEDGFLLHAEAWNRAVAQQFADEVGIGSLGDTHWLIIDFMRDRYLVLGALPPMRNLCRKVGVDRNAVKCAFGSCREAWRIAGLPNPGPEAMAYMA